MKQFRQHPVDFSQEHPTHVFDKFNIIVFLLKKNYMRK